MLFSSSYGAISYGMAGMRTASYSNQREAQLQVGTLVYHWGTFNIQQGARNSGKFGMRNLPSGGRMHSLEGGGAGQPLLQTHTSSGHARTLHCRPVCHVRAMEALTARRALAVRAAHQDARTNITHYAYPGDP